VFDLLLFTTDIRHTMRMDHLKIPLYEVQFTAKTRCHLFRGAQLLAQVHGRTNGWTEQL